MTEHSIKLKQKYKDRKGKYNMTYTDIVDIESIVNVNKQDSANATKLFASTWNFVKTAPRNLRRAVTSNKFKALIKPAVTVIAAIATVIAIFYINILVAAGLSLIWPPLAFIYLLLCTLSAFSWLYATFTFQKKVSEAEDLITSTFGMTDLFTQTNYWEPTGVSILDEEE